MAITASDVKQLREATGLGMMDCKKALEASGGDQQKAVELLRKKGLKTAQKRSGRTTSNGTVVGYMHHTGRVGVMAQLNCETDFVARNEEFQAFGRELCKHICAFNPIAVSRDQVDPAAVDAELRIATEQVQDKPEHVQKKIIDGKLDKFFSEGVLIEQPWIHDDKKSVGDVLKELIGKIGENMTIARFARFDVADPLPETAETEEAEE